MKSLQELGDEAFRDLLRKHRAVTLKEALRQSTRQLCANAMAPLVFWNRIHFLHVDR